MDEARRPTTRGDDLRLSPAAIGALAAVGLSLLISPAAASAHYSTGIYTPNPSSGPSGTRLALQGLLHAEPGRITLRWDSASGPSIGQVALAADRHSYSAQVTIPVATPGVHLIVLAADDQKIAEAAFEVLPAPPHISTAPHTPAPIAGRWWNLSPAAAAVVGVAVVALVLGRRWRLRRSR